MCIKDTLDDDEPIPNMAKFFGQQKPGQKGASPRKKKKSEVGVSKRQKLGKIEKVSSRFRKSKFSKHS